MEMKKIEQGEELKTSPAMDSFPTAERAKAEAKETFKRQVKKALAEIIAQHGVNKIELNISDVAEEAVNELKVELEGKGYVVDTIFGRRGEIGSKILRIEFK